MNKKYMDFVPAKSNKMSVNRARKVARPESKPEIVYPKVKAGAVRSKREKRKTVSSVARPSLTKVSEGIALGVVEDLELGFVEPDTIERPLSKPKDADSGRQEVLKAKSEKVGARRMIRGKNRPVEKVVEKSKAENKKDVFVPPKNPFINQEKVIKRPLSKNVYQKKVEVPKEESKGPVTIIAKPEKDAHVSLVVAVILTIILGAAAGTVAFLLLPK